MKIQIRGYRSQWSGWRYRATGPCGWSLDLPAYLIPVLRYGINDHRGECRRCA